MNPPLLCRLGIHGWYTDSAMFTSVRRCRKCETPENPEKAARLERERGLWDEYGDEPNPVRAISAILLDEESA